VAPADLRRASSVADFASAIALFREYEAEIQIDLCFQNFEAELADLGAAYEAILLAEINHLCVGCVALKRHDERRCEMKRLYVRPSARSGGLGSKLAEAIIEDAQKSGYSEMVLDTFEWMERALAMYLRLGFVRTEAYYDNPSPDAIYLLLNLKAR
jgi:ribosomal protein S18 acetylase RimI-like enzyme